MGRLGVLENGPNLTGIAPFQGLVHLGIVLLEQRPFRRPNSAVGRLLFSDTPPPQIILCPINGKAQKT